MGPLKVVFETVICAFVVSLIVRFCVIGHLLSKQMSCSKEVCLFLFFNEFWF